jgi:DNA-binding transcriptional LysR family regulator
MEHGSVTLAAETLFLTQSATSKNILKLEEELGVLLFDRTAGRMTPTSFGLALAHHARVLNDKSANARHEIEMLRRGAYGTLNIGAGPSWSVVFLPKAIRRLQMKKPGVRVRSISNAIGRLVPQLLSGEIDLICATLDFPDHEDIEKLQLVEGSYVIMAHQDHPLHRKSSIELAELLDYPWVGFSDDMFVNRRIADFFMANGLTVPRPDVEVSNLGAMFAVAQTEDMLVAASSLTLPHAQYFGLSPIPVQAKVWTFPAGLAFRKKQSSPLVEAMIEELKEETAGFSKLITGK